MKTFRDNAGRVWTVSINVWTARRVHAETGVHIPSLIDDGFAGYRKLVSDELLLGNVVYALCRDEADKQGVDEAGFLSALSGDATEGALQAFRSEFQDFFRLPGQRAGVQQALAILDQLETEARKQAVETLASIDVPSVARMLIESSGESPESSESTPDLSPSDSSS